MEQEVVGFLPYWQKEESKYVQARLLSEVVFSSLTADKNGQIVTQVGNGEEPGWRSWNSAAVRDEIANVQIAGAKFSLSVFLQDGIQLGALLDNTAAQQKLIDVLVSQVRVNHLDGLNVDFEFTGDSTPAHQHVFTQFAAQLVAFVHQASPKAEVSIDLPAISARKAGLYDVASLAQTFDRVIVMSYDYYAAGSDVAGPVAPMSGFQDGTYFFDVTTTYDDYAAFVPASKLLMGVPYYGYDWPVTDNTKPLALTVPASDGGGQAKTVSYSQLKRDQHLYGSNCHWDAAASETWCAYTDPNTHQQREVWLEDNQSVSIKFDFAKQRKFQGVALWALGFDGNYPDLWAMLAKDFTTPAT